MAKSKEITAEFALATEMLNRMTTLSQVAQFIARAWPNVWFGAVPYLQAMGNGDSLDPRERYMYEDQKTMVLYFLSNASTWKGEVAKATKAFLKAKYMGGAR